MYIIDWNMLLHDDYTSVHQMLTDMLSKMTYEQIAKKLGVAEKTLYRKVKTMKIFNPKADPKVKRQFITDRAMEAR